jgi:hypothetical protein
MNTWLIRCFAGLLLVLPFVPAVADDPDDKEIARLVKQLGSSDFRTRDEATKRLEAISDVLLDALQKAQKSSDPEVCRRAQGILTSIDSKLRGAYLADGLKPQTVWQGTCEDTGGQAAMILFVKTRKGDQFQGTVWYPAPINNNGLADISGRIDAKGAMTFSEHRIQGTIDDGVTYTATLQGRTIAGSYYRGVGKILLKLAE